MHLILGVGTGNGGFETQPKKVYRILATATNPDPT